MKAHTQCLSRIFLVLLLSALLGIRPATATGPRVSADLFAPHANQVYAVDLPPFIDSEGGGLSAEIVRAAMAAAQVEFVLTALPLQTMLRYYLFEENALAVLGRDLSLSEEEKAGLIFVPVFVAEERYWHARRARPPAWDGKLESLAGRVYGAYKGEDIQAYQAAGVGIEYGRGKHLIEKLVAGKVDFIRLPDLSVEWLVNAYFPKERDNIVPLEPGLGEAPLFAVFNRKHPDGAAIADTFRQGLARIVADGRYRAILEKYLDKEAAVARTQRLAHYLTQP